MRALILLVILLTGCTEEKFFQPGSGGGNGDNQSHTVVPANLVVSATLLDFGVRSIFSVNTLAVVVTNQGTVPATNVLVSSPSGAFAIQTAPGATGCSGSVEPGDCTLQVMYRPTSILESLDVIDLTYQSGEETKTVRINMRGRGTNVAHLEISNGNNLGFTQLGTTLTNTSLERSFDVLYSGVAPATGVSFSGLVAPFEVVTDPIKTTCGLTVSQNCKVTVRFGSPTVGEFSSLLKVTYNNSAFADQDQHVVMAKAEAVAVQPTLSLSDFAYGTRLIGADHDAFLTINYSGTVPAMNVGNFTFNGAGFSFVGGSFPGVGGTCSSNGVIAATCTIAVRFSPAAVITYLASLSFRYDNGAPGAIVKNATAALSGNGANPAVLSWTDVNPATYDFRKVSVGKPVIATLRVTNSANSVPATGISLRGLSGVFGYSTGSCGATLASGASCNVNVRFLPNAVVASMQNAEVSYNDGRQARTLSRAVLGEGDSSLELAAAATLDFGNVVVNERKTLFLTIRSYGTEPVIWSAVDPLAPFSYPGGLFPGTGGTCPNTVNPGSCTVGLTFAPTALQLYDSQYRITYTVAGMNKELIVQLRGRGVNPPAILTFESPTLNFGDVNVGSSAALTIRVIKTGTAPAVSVNGTGLGSGFSFKGGTFPGTGGTCSATVSTDCTLALLFAPAVGGAATSAFKLNYNDGITARQASLSLQGNGLNAAALLFQNANGDFGKVPANTTKTVVFTLKNTGTLTGTIASIGVTGPGFSNSTSCGTALAADQTCTVTVSFNSNLPGPIEGQLLVQYMNGTGGSASSTLALQAIATVPVAQIAGNGNHTCAISDISQVKCWGQNNYGQLGIGNTTNRGDSAASDHQMGTALPHVDLGPGEIVSSIAVGYWHNCAVLKSGKLKCWGWNESGQLGQGDSRGNKMSIGDEPGELGAALPAIELGTGRTVRSVAAGYSHTCAILDNGRVKCWGLNSRGQLGVGDTINRGELPTQMGDALPYVDLDGKKAVQLALDAGHSCALLEDNSLRCWGDNFYGQLGQGDSANRGDGPDEMGMNLPAISLGSGRSAKAVSAGGGFTCAILDNGAVKCFGLNRSGTLGRLWCQNRLEQFGPCTDPSLPFPLYGLGTSPAHLGDALIAVKLGTGRTAKAISSGNFHTCAILDDNSVKCWGSNEYGQLGYGTTTNLGLSDAEMGDALPTVAAFPGKTLVEISAGNNHTCARFETGDVKCWGDNRFGGLGLGDTERRGDQANEMGANLPIISW